MGAPADIPSPEADALAYRRALSRYATGVCVVYAEAPGGPCGITINSFSSVSLAPPIVLWCLDCGAERAPVFCEAQTWGVSVLTAAQEPLARRFAQAGAAPAAPHEASLWAGVPVAPGALAQFACRTIDRRRLGDHWVIAGEVTGFASTAGDGLTYFSSRFGVAPDPQGLEPQG